MGDKIKSSNWYEALIFKNGGRGNKSNKYHVKSKNKSSKRHNKKNFFYQINFLKPFHATGFFLYPLKTSENQQFFDVFRGDKKRRVV